ncbi:hypothetical protein [Bacillus thuringiensis]|uniref:hypothetical protein n=1 Tax=Bacillus thuringiensis TaxID=1428 RepID=UPI003BF9252F
MDYVKGYIVVSIVNLLLVDVLCVDKERGKKYMEKYFEDTKENREWFESFVKSDEFSEALGIVWKYGKERWTYFTIGNKKREIVSRFVEIVKGTSPMRANFIKQDNYTQWCCNMNLKHPFLIKIKEMGWTPRMEQEREYPKGEFHHAVFIKTYIRICHEVGTMRKKTRKGIKVTCARLRIHGSKDMLQHINKHLHDALGISLKKLQKDTSSNRVKVLYYQSQKDIPVILKYIGAKESLEKFNSFNLGDIEN